MKERPDKLENYDFYACYGNDGYIEELNNMGINSAHPTVTHYAGQTRQLRKIILNSVGYNVNLMQEVAIATDNSLEDSVIKNRYIPMTTGSSDETIYLVPYEILQNCVRLER